MKPAEFIVENSIIAQEADDMHRDHEVQMARSQMYSAAQAAIEIHKLLRDVSEMEGLEGWVQSKLTLASQYLESVRDYMKYEAVSQEPEMMAFAEGAADYAIESLLAEDDDDPIKVHKPGGDYVDPEKGYAPSRPRDRIMSAPKGEINPDLQRYAQRNIPSNLGDEGLPGAKRTGPSGPQGAGVRDFTQSGQLVGGGKASRVERPEGVPRVSKIPATRFGGGSGGGGGGMSMFDLANRRFRPMQYESDEPVNEMGETGEERDLAARREEERYDSARNYQGRNARGDVIRSGGEVVRGNPNPPSLIQRAAGKLGLPNTATDALGGPMYKSSRPSGGRGMGGGGGGGGGGGMNPFEKNKRSLYFEKKESVKESATGGASSAGAVATSIGGPGHKPTSGVPKKVGNTYKQKKVAVGKGVYDR